MANFFEAVGMLTLTAVGASVVYFVVWFGCTLWSMRGMDAVPTLKCANCKREYETVFACQTCVAGGYVPEEEEVRRP